VIELARANGYKVTERHMKPEELAGFEECFLTGTAAEVIPVVSLDRRMIGDGKPGPITARFIAAFRELANSTGSPVA